MRTRPLITSTLLLVALAGCGGNDPAPDPTPSPSPTATATGRVAPALPPAAKAHTKAGAIAFVRHYVATFNYSQTTGDTEPLSKLGSATCKSCASVVAAINHVYESGGHAVGGELSIDGVEAVPSVNHAVEVDIAGTFTKSVVVPSEGASSEVRPPASTVASFFVRFTKSWKVVRWSRAS